jgi:hypothetical protein
LRCSTATAETANAPVALLSLPVSLSWYRTLRSPVRRRRSRFVLAAVLSPLAAFARIVALLYSRVAKLPQDLCPFAFPRWTIKWSFSRCWTFGHPVRNRGFAFARKSLSILSRLSSAKSACHPTKEAVFLLPQSRRSHWSALGNTDSSAATGNSRPLDLLKSSLWSSHSQPAVS